MLTFGPYQEKLSEQGVVNILEGFIEYIARLKGGKYYWKFADALPEASAQVIIDNTIEDELQAYHEILSKFHRVVTERMSLNYIEEDVLALKVPLIKPKRKTQLSVFQAALYVDLLSKSGIIPYDERKDLAKGGAALFQYHPKSIYDELPKLHSAELKDYLAIEKYLNKAKEHVDERITFLEKRL